MLINEKEGEVFSLSLIIYSANHFVTFTIKFFQH